VELNYLVVDKTSKIGVDVKLDDFVSIRPGAVIGNRVEIKCRATIGKNCTVGDGVFIGAHSILCNGKESPEDSPSHVLDGCFIGATVTILPGVTVGPDVIIGAGSVVVNNITEKGTYAGNPCKKIT
jgi:acetyltransferase-like isoleucine patch superfamily enzyme